MKISELIAKLEAIKEQCGDIAVCVNDRDSRFYEHDDITSIELWPETRNEQKCVILD